MEISTSYTDKFKKPTPAHPLAACAELINEAGLFTVKYGRGYWLRLLKQYATRHRTSPEALYNELDGMLNGSDGIMRMNEKYSKGGTLTNKLRRL